MSMIVPNIEELIAPDDEYRKMLEVLDWNKLCEPLRKKYSPIGRAGYPPEQAFRCIFLQFLNDLSDRSLERVLRYDISAKYFCNFGLMDETPDFTFFSKFRERIGTKLLGDIFKNVSNSLENAGLIRGVFTFVDSSKIEACVDTWKARDKAIEDIQNEEKDDDGKPTMNNKNADNYLSDKDARYGVKGNKDIWAGYKRHVSVDAHQGLIVKVAITPANIHDGKGVKHILPKTGAILGDKIYGHGQAQKSIKAKVLHSMALKNNNAKDKNKKKDAFFSSLRMPFEGVFSKMNKRARYRGKAKVQFQGFMQAFAHNLKRLIKINCDPIPIS